MLTYKIDFLNNNINVQNFVENESDICTCIIILTWLSEVTLLDNPSKITINFIKRYLKKMFSYLSGRTFPV